MIEHLLRGRRGYGDDPVVSVGAPTSLHHVRLRHQGGQSRGRPGPLDVHDNAWEHIEQKALNIFDFDDDFNTIAQRDGVPLLGEKGNPYSYEDFAAELNEKDPYFFKANIKSGLDSKTLDNNNRSINVRVIDRNDQKAFGANIEAIAKGEVMVK